MHEQDIAILKSLVSVAWADGRVAESETQVIEALISAFGASADEAASIREYAKTKKTLDDIPLTDLSADDRRTLVQHAVLLSFADGEQAPEEKKLIDDLCGRLHIPAAEKTELLGAAEARVKKYLNLL